MASCRTGIHRRLRPVDDLGVDEQRERTALDVAHAEWVADGAPRHHPYLDLCRAARVVPTRVGV